MGFQTSVCTSSSSDFRAGQRFPQHRRTMEVTPGRINKLEPDYGGYARQNK